MRLTVSDMHNEPIGEIWSEGDATIRARPDGMITMTNRFLESNPGLGAPQVLALMDGWSNGYVTCHAVSEPV